MKLPQRFSFPPDFCPPDQLSGLPTDTPILLGFSGGADSTLLLFLLALWCRRWGTPLWVAHVHHGIRGEEADRDEAFCRQTAEELGLPFESIRADIPTLAKERGESIETCARNVRYEYFDRLMREHHIPILATAHNADDNLETVLFHLIRGAGLCGLCGIPTTRSAANGVVIRPLLRMEKDTVLSLCKTYGLSYVCDRTNTDTDYTRNRIRADILPQIKKINPGATRSVSRATESLYEDSLCLLTMSNWFLEELEADGGIETEKLCGSPPAVVNRALMSLFTRLSGGCTLEHTHVMALRRLAEANVPHSSLSLPGRMMAVMEDGRLFFRPACPPCTPDPYCIPLGE
ncbi:MAG: tRNA lysidine(34) synthetase TilS, partial [Clostridia bacterium]|nr:tRNA lysidine(34) synthetase TilS [Clostridia bacterium]